MEHKQYLGIEFGSTRIKAVLIDEKGNVLCSGGYEWKNTLVGGYWSYDMEDVVKGMQASYAGLNASYVTKYGQPIRKIDGMGVSAMMHGYLAFDEKYNLLTPFRTWRNTNTASAAEELCKELHFNMPQRWSAAHFYQAVLDGEKHVNKVAHLHTLASYVHYLLTGQNVIGIGDGSGMFPMLDTDFDKVRIKIYNDLLKKHGVQKDLYALLPKVLLAGENAGVLTREGAILLDTSGQLQAGIVLCPPEGDAGTGMTATNSIQEKTGNVSAGTSAFAMIVLEKPLKNVYPEIDMVTTPAGKLVAMVHVNNCTSEINAWAGIFAEAITLAGGSIEKGDLLTRLFNTTRSSDDDCGKYVGYNFLSGEPIAGTQNGAPLLFRVPDGVPTLANFMQMQIYSALASLRLGIEILEKEHVQVKEICGHGGFFKTEYIGQNSMSAALNAPVTVMKNAGEGGAWGIALLACYADGSKGTLNEFLQTVFADTEKTTVVANEHEKKKFAVFMARYKANLTVEKLAATVGNKA